MALVEGPFWQEWNSRGVRPHERYDAWQDMLNSSHLRWTLDGTGVRDFFAKLEIGRLAGLQVVRSLCDPCQGLRQPAEIARDTEAYYGLLLIFEGQEDVNCRGLCTTLGPGGFLVWDSTSPISFKLLSPIHKITLFVKQERMRNTLPQVDSLVGQALDWRQGFGAVAASHLSALASQVAHMDIDKAHPLAENTLELIATCLENSRLPMSGPAQADLLVRIKGYIDANLEDSTLGPPGLAKSFGISVRYLHLLFKAENLTVSRWIMERRLEHCRRDLIRASMRKNITEVAFRWGFNDSAHFSRVFKKRYGQSPRDFRDRHIP
jgi:AraC-like DNA-binding protein